ncbi:MAG: ABC transporter permease [Crocinitomicaceae bacterium]|nr:ABC transporter permease [Crocinitomicaceae bacterium]
MINLISSISVFGIAISTAAMVIVMSAFNGIEEMVVSLYSEFEPDIRIYSAQGKTFDADQINYDELNSVDGIESYSKIIEEITILKHEDKWVNSTMLGVEESFVKMTNLEKKVITGSGTIEDNYGAMAVIGAGLLEKLEGFIPEDPNQFESVNIYAPLRDKKASMTSKPFSIKRIELSGRFSYNKDVDFKYFVVPIWYAREILEYKNDITWVGVELKEGAEPETVRDQIRAKLGDDFIVKTQYEQNELIYKTSQTERWITLLVLGFIFILSTFNMIASLSMLFLEKVGDLNTIQSFGGSKAMIRNIFLKEGLLINGLGVIIGVILGYLICILQMKFEFVSLDETSQEPFPIKFLARDGFIIMAIVGIIGFLSSFIPVKYLMKKHLN